MPPNVDQTRRPVREQERRIRRRTHVGKEYRIDDTRPLSAHQNARSLCRRIHNRTGEAWGVFSRRSHYVLAAQTVNTFLNSSAPTTLIASMITADAGDGNQVSDTLAVVSVA